MAAEGWLALARAAVSARDAARAQAAARRARDIGHVRRQAQLVIEAESVLDSARLAVPAPAPRDPDGGRVFHEAGELARQVVESLARVPC